jgi:hypothetical protein
MIIFVFQKKYSHKKNPALSLKKIFNELYV